MKNEIQNYMSHISTNYNSWYLNSNMSKTSAEWRMKEFRENVHTVEVVTPPKKISLKAFSFTVPQDGYPNLTKVMCKNDLHSYIVREDDSKFKKGDILKADRRSPCFPDETAVVGNVFDVDSYKNLKWSGA